MSFTPTYTEPHWRSIIVLLRDVKVEGGVFNKGHEFYFGRRDGQGYYEFIDEEGRCIRGESITREVDYNCKFIFNEGLGDNNPAPGYEWVKTIKAKKRYRVIQA